MPTPDAREFRRDVFAVPRRVTSRSLRWRRAARSPTRAWAADLRSPTARKPAAGATARGRRVWPPRRRKSLRRWPPPEQGFLDGSAPGKNIRPQMTGRGPLAQQCDQLPDRAAANRCLAIFCTFAGVDDALLSDAEQVRSVTNSGRTPPRNRLRAGCRFATSFACRSPRLHPVHDWWSVGPCRVVVLDNHPEKGPP